MQSLHNHLPALQINQELSQQLAANLAADEQLASRVLLHNSARLPAHDNA